MTCTVKATKILIVNIFIVQIGFIRGELARVGSKLRVTAIATEVPFGIKLNKFMVLVTI